MGTCKALNNHMCVTLENSWAPCCRFANKEFFDVNTVAFEEYRQSKFYKQIKKDNSKKWSPGCQKCQEQERTRGTSYRKFFDQYETENNIEFVELSLSNQCNLACRMCSPTYSTTWGDLLKNNPPLEKYIRSAKETSISIENIFGQIDLSHLKRIKYLGGEPFITPEIKDLFEYLDKHNIIGNITFECNTNCTLFPQKYLDYLKKFKNLEISLSIDGIGPVNDYIRHGKPWEIINKNINKWIEFRDKSKNVDLILFTTVQAYNLHNIKRIKKFAKKRNIKFEGAVLTHPEFLSINALPRPYVTEIKDKDNAEFIRSYNSYYYLGKDFKIYTKRYDQATGTALKNVIPKLAEYMEM